MKDSHALNDTLNVSLLFENGSIATISYFSNGSKKLKKEYIEIFSNEISYVVDDFKELRIYSNVVKGYKNLNQDKGHSLQVKEFINAIKSEQDAPIPFGEIYTSTKLTFDVIKSIS